MKLQVLLRCLFEEVEEEESETSEFLRIPIGDLVVNRNSLFDAYEDCFWRNACSRTRGPVKVIEIEGEPGKYQLVDGYHRFVTFLINRRHKSDGGYIPVEVSHAYLDRDWAITPMNQRWEYISRKKYANLEDLAVRSILDDHVRKMRRGNEQK